MSTLLPVIESPATPVTVKDYKPSDVKVHWCPGCGDFAVLASIFKGLAELQIRPENTVIASGIGCSSRLPYFTKAYGLHGVHGRSLPLATGVKLARPDLTVLAVGGDGDMFSIGTGHLPHAARRNVDVVCINMDNEVYGTTKGQLSPTSKLGYVSKTSPFGAVELPMNPVLQALTGGASFVARAYSAKPKQLQALITAGIQHRGFAFIHVVSPCTEFHNTFNEYDPIVQDLPADYDPTNLAQAFQTIVTEEKVNLGIVYKKDRAPFGEALRSAANGSSEFDLTEHLAGFM